MSTPLKQLRVLLSPKILTHLSSNTSPIFDYNLISTSPIKNNQLSTPIGNNLDNGTLKLRIPNNKDLCKLSNSPNTIRKTSPIFTYDFVNDENHESNLLDILNVNSPEKLLIQEEGIEMRRNLNVLGRGRFGTVVKGCYKGSSVAVKVIKLAPCIKLSVNESNALQLSNEHVVKTIDVILNASLNYGIVIMEYLENCKNLQTILDRSPLENRICIKFAIDICEGLFYCHKNNIFHLDLKPKNILISQDNKCKLCDFGNSYKEGETINYTHQGTVAYTAPEILLGKTPLKKCDIYSLGIIFWQMKTGQMPYVNITTKEVLIYKVVKFELRPENQSSYSKSDIFSRLYRNCWSTDPVNRPDINKILQILHKIHC